MSGTSAGLSSRSRKRRHRATWYVLFSRYACSRTDLAMVWTAGSAAGVFASSRAMPASAAGPIPWATVAGAAAAPYF
jgi:hypothetical protein